MFSERDSEKEVPLYHNSLSKQVYLLGLSRRQLWINSESVFSKFSNGRILGKQPSIGDCIFASKENR